MLHTTGRENPYAQSAAQCKLPFVATTRERLWNNERTHDRVIAALAVPALGSLAAPPLVGLVDVFIAGRLSTPEQSGLAIGVALFGLLVFSTNFLEYGTTALVAQETGTGSERGARSVLKRALAMALVLGLALTVLGVLAGEWLASSVMQAEGGVASGAATFLAIRMLGAVPFMIMRVGHGWFRGRGDTRTPLFIAVGIAVLAIVLAPILALGIGGWEGWGLEGIAIATAGAEILGALVFAVLLLRGYPRVDSIGVAAANEDRELPGWTRLISLNRDILVRTLAVTGTFTLASAVAASSDAGGVTAAGHGIVASTWIFTALVLDSLAIAAQSMVGRFVGAGGKSEAARVTARIVTLELLAGVVLGALMLAALPLIRDGFSSDPAVRDALTPALIVLALSMPINAVVFGIDGALIGAGDGAFMRNSMVAAAIPACVVLFVLMALGTTLTAIWLTVAAFLALRLAFMIARIRTGAWLNQAVMRADGPTSTTVENPSAAR